ncbi:GFA family protein [Ruegeria pomeroyi]|nr:GFA family protein [Ruegeria pomeroyi]
MQDVVTGRCLCGNVEYSIENDFLFLLFCHCEQCRRISGSAHASNLFSATQSLTWLKGEESIQRFDYPGRDFTKSFCRMCGCGLPYRSSHGEMVIVPAGTLDGEPKFATHGKVFLAECTEWTHSTADTKLFDGFPDFSGS